MLFRPRIIILACGVFALLSILVVQFFKVQIIQEKKWQKYAKAQHELVVREPFKRGVFYSNLDIVDQTKQKEQPLVLDIPKFHFYADPFQIPENKHLEVSKKISEILGSTTLDEAKVLKELKHQKSRSRKLVMWLDQSQKNELNNWWFNFAKKNKLASNALYFINDYKRSYPFGSLLGQVLHTIQDQKEELTCQGIPTGGLEYFFNTQLKGKEGKKKLIRSPKHPLDMAQTVVAPQHGSDVYLTINHHLQAIAEQEIEKGVKVAEAKSGWAIIMDPQNGHILAFAQYPFFSPDNYKDYYNNEERVEDTRLKGICDSYEPGSIFKPITVAICYLANQELQKRGKEPIFDPHEKISTSSGKFVGREYKDLPDNGVYKYTNMYLCLQKTTNRYLARLSERIIKELGANWYREQLVNVFGFNQKTHIEYPAEAIGMVPTPGKLHPNKTPEWSVPTPFSLVMGHSLQVNSVQMIRAFSSIVNGGYLVQPTFVKKIVKKNDDGSQEVLLDHTSKQYNESFKKILEPYMCNEIIKGMKFVVRDGGSGHRADVFGYTVAGKTSTANKIVDGKYSKKAYFSSFIGFAPANNPRFVVLVSMDEPKAGFKSGVGYNHSGGVCSAPVFREVTRRALKYLGIVEDNPYHYPPGDPRYDPKKAHWFKENKELKELNEKWN